MNIIENMQPYYRLKRMLREKSILIKGPRIVAIGGGTGLSTMLRGLKLFSSNLTAVVTVTDDGGSSGILRDDLGILPPGDIRNCVLALADTEPIMEKLLQYRFKEGMLKDQCFGNLFLAALHGISSNFEEAVRKMNHVLAVTGRVLPVTVNDTRLCAELEDGFVIAGESRISKHNLIHPGRIKRIYLEPENVTPLQDVLDAMNEADTIILGPGSLYTSIIPNLLVEGVCDALKSAKAPKIFICNIMTQPGETDGMDMNDHVKAIEMHSYKGIVDYCIINDAPIPHEFIRRYTEDGAAPVTAITAAPMKILKDNLLNTNGGYVRHNPLKLAVKIMGLIAEEVLARDGRRRIDYLFIKDRLKGL